MNCVPDKLLGASFALDAMDRTIVERLQGDWAIHRTPIAVTVIRHTFSTTKPNLSLTLTWQLITIYPDLFGLALPQEAAGSC
jgi:hypothetical protein